MTQSLLTEVRGAVGVVTLNRPKALNALNVEMIDVLTPQLDAWAVDPGIRAVVIRGAGPKAFCAGGDVRAVCVAVEEQSHAREFFRGEYTLNHRIHHFPKPYVALVDGICMGGGLGLSIHGSHRVITERLTLAMPETAIGLFPDVGGGWFLPRFPGEVGTYLGLTGSSCGAADAKWLGYATHSIPSAQLENVLEALVTASWSEGAPGSVADEVLSRFTHELGPSALAGRREEIDRCFGKHSVEEIFAALKNEGTQWAEETHALLSRRCPFSLAVTLRQLRLGRTLSYDEVARLEYRLALALTARGDFREGVRAVLLDKDNAPRWSPSRLAEVRAEEVVACFDRAGDELELTLP